VTLFATRHHGTHPDGYAARLTNYRGITTMAYVAWDMEDRGLVQGEKREVD
jgi:hypothetical protein